MLRLHQITKIYQHAEVLKDATWEVKPGERVGLVGVNGSGKTTQFKIILNQIEASSGEMQKPKSDKIGYLSQEFDIDPTNTIREELLKAFSEAHDIKLELASVQETLEKSDSLEEFELNRAIKKLDRLQTEFEQINGYDLERRVDQILPDIGFETTDGDRKVSTLSGGWQMRLGFGKVMLREPELLLLDEPTNHIDLETIEWVESYLKKQEVPMVIVSHDRSFLDQLCTKIVELERGTTKTYPGNYSKYKEIKDGERAIQQAAFERQQVEMERQQVFINKFRASATRSTQAKSREKQLEKLDLIEEPERDLKSLKFSFPTSKRTGKDVAQVVDLMHVYDDNILFLDANFKINRGDKIALLGPNGCGKSTLLRLLAGKEEPSDGEVKLGDHNVDLAYYEQNQAEALDKEKTVLETIADEVFKWTDTEIRTLLGQFLFSGDSVFKDVGTLSGGEKARLAIAKLLTSPANFLLLDEPTNHLDIPAKETLESAIKGFSGALIVVSHDRYFIKQVANKIAVVEDAKIKVYDGNYEYYLEKVEEEKEELLRLEKAKLAEEKRLKKQAKKLEKEKAKKSLKKPKS